MSTQSIETPGPDDVVYEKTPPLPWYLKYANLFAWGFLFLTFFGGVCFGVSQGVAIVFSIVGLAGFVVISMLEIRGLERWRSTFRWYRSSIKSVQSTSDLSNYQQALRSQPSNAQITIEMSNGHALEFANDVPPELVTAPYVLYRAARVRGEFTFLDEQPAV